MSAQMANQAAPVLLRATELDQQQPAARLEDTHHCEDGGVGGGIGKEVNDRRAEHDVEGRFGEWQRLGPSQLEIDCGASSCCLFARARSSRAMRPARIPYPPGRPGALQQWR